MLMYLNHGQAAEELALAFEHCKHEIKDPEHIDLIQKLLTFSQQHKGTAYLAALVFRCIEFVSTHAETGRFQHLGIEMWRATLAQAASAFRRGKLPEDCNVPGQDIAWEGVLKNGHSDLMQCSIWKPLDNRDNPWILILSKVFPQRCQIREASDTVIDWMKLCPEFGADFSAWMDAALVFGPLFATTDPPNRSRSRLSLKRLTEFYDMTGTPERHSLFHMLLLKHQELLCIFLTRLYLCHLLPQQPALLAAVRATFFWSKFVTICGTLANQLHDQINREGWGCLFGQPLDGMDKWFDALLPYWRYISKAGEEDMLPRTPESIQSAISAVPKETLDKFSPRIVILKILHRHGEGAELRLVEDILIPSSVTMETLLNMAPLRDWIDPSTGTLNVASMGPICDALVQAGCHDPHPHLQLRVQAASCPDVVSTGPIHIRNETPVPTHASRGGPAPKPTRRKRKRKKRTKEKAAELQICLDAQREMQTIFYHRVQSGFLGLLYSSRNKVPPTTFQPYPGVDSKDMNEHGITNTHFAQLAAWVDRLSPDCSEAEALRLLPAFGASEKGMKILNRLKHDHESQHGKKTIVNGLLHFAMWFPYTNALAHSLAFLLARHQTFQQFALPKAYMEGQIRAIRGKWGLKPTDPIPLDACWLKVCRTCDHVFSLTNDDKVIWKAIDTFGYKYVCANLATGDEYCSRNTVIAHAHVKDTRLTKIWILGRALVWRNRIYLLCPGDSCGIPFVYSERSAYHGERGYLCSACSAILQGRTDVKFTGKQKRPGGMATLALRLAAAAAATQNNVGGGFGAGGLDMSALGQPLADAVVGQRGKKRKKKMPVARKKLQLTKLVPDPLREL